MLVRCSVWCNTVWFGVECGVSYIRFFLFFAATATVATWQNVSATHLFWRRGFPCCVGLSLHLWSSAMLNTPIANVECGQKQVALEEPSENAAGGVRRKAVRSCGWRRGEEGGGPHPKNSGGASRCARTPQDESSWFNSSGAQKASATTFLPKQREG